MSEIPPSELLPEILDGRFASVVYIMKGRRSPFSRLGVLELDAGQLSLRDSKGGLLFAVPAASAQARPARRRSAEMHRTAFEVCAGDQWWFLVGHVPTNYERRSTRDLVEHSRARELAPRPSGMSEETYLRLTKNPISHQLLWRACWLEALTRRPA
jgi:hypothetical protein